jgi:hypothetical protein
MKTNKLKHIWGALVLLSFARHTFAVVDQAVEVQGTNLVLSWPSLGYESYLIQYRPTLGADTPWQQLTNAYHANSTNRTKFVLPCCALAALGGSNNLRSISSGASEKEKPALKQAEESKSPMQDFWVREKNGLSGAIPFSLYPPGADTKNLIACDPPKQNPKPKSANKLKSSGEEQNGAFRFSNGGCDCPDMGFFRVFHVPDFPSGIANYTFDGPIFIPVDFKDYQERVEDIQVLLDGQPTLLSEYISLFYNNQTNWGMGIYFDRLANGTHQIQLRSTLRMADVVDGDTPMLVLSNRVRSILADNQVTFTNWDDLVWNNTDYTFKAQLKSPNSDWWIDVFDVWGNYLNGGSGHTSNGQVAWTWDLTDTASNLHDSLENDPFFDSYITFQSTSPATPAAAPTTKRTPIPVIAYPNVGRWIVTYLDTFYEPGTTAGNIYIAGINAIAGGPAFRGIPVSVIPLKFGTNNYSQEQRDDSWVDLKASMFSPDARNLYYAGHGWATGIGGDRHTYDTNGGVTGGIVLPSSKAFLTSKTVRDSITFNKHGGFRPYRFVWLDGCSTVNGDWPEAFGVNKATNSIAYYTNKVTNPSGVRPSAFVGWNQTVGGTNWGTLQGYMNCRSQWMFRWQYNWNTEELIDSLEFGRNISNWIPEQKFLGAIRVYGYTKLRMNEFNQRTDWPQP